MNFPAGLLPSAVHWAAHLGWLLVLAAAIRHAPWRRFAERRRQHVYLGAMVALLLLWRFDASVTPGLGFHFLGLTVFTLMFGWSLGVVGSALVMLGSTLAQGGALETLSLNALVLGALPVTVSYGWYYAVQRWLPHHVFIYIFLDAFLGAIIAAAVTVLTLVWILVITDTYGWSRIAHEYLPFLPLYLFPEGLLNGMLATVFVGLRPEWLATFDDDSYLKR